MLGYLLVLCIALVVHVIAKAIYKRPFTAWFIPCGTFLFIAAVLADQFGASAHSEGQGASAIPYAVGCVGGTLFVLGFECLRISLGFGFWWWRDKEGKPNNQEHEGSNDRSPPENNDREGAQRPENRLK